MLITDTVLKVQAVFCRHADQDAAVLAIYGNQRRSKQQNREQQCKSVIFFR